MKSKKPAKKHVDLELGELPVEYINASLGLELDPGPAILSGVASKHAEKHHPDDYAICLPHIAGILARPLYIGDDFKNRDNIELVGRIPTISSHILVAVKIVPDGEGRYRVASFYRISQQKVERRKASGHLVWASKNKAPL